MVSAERGLLTAERSNDEATGDGGGCDAGLMTRMRVMLLQMMMVMMMMMRRRRVMVMMRGW